MAKKSKQQADGDAPEGDEGGAAKKRKRPSLIVIGLCLALAGGGYLLGGRSAGAQGGGAHAATTTTILQLEGCKEGTDARDVEHRAIDLPAMNVNLEGGHYLRVMVSLALCPDVVLAKPEEFVTAPAKDIVVATLSGRKMSVLAEPEGREQVKRELTERIAAAYPEQVYEIWFLEFVMQ